MTFTYSDPSGSTLEAVRFRLSDTEEDGALFSDEEITYALGAGNNVLAACVTLCRTMAGRYANKRDRAMGPITEQFQQQFDRWVALCQDFEKELANGLGGKGLGPDGTYQVGAPELMGGGEKYLAPDDTPLTYNEGEYTDVDS